MRSNYLKPVNCFLRFGDSYPKPVKGDRYISKMDDKWGEVWLNNKIVEYDGESWVNDPVNIGDIVYANVHRSYYEYIRYNSVGEATWKFVEKLSSLEHIRYLLKFREGFGQELVQVLDEYYSGENYGRKCK